MAQAKIITLPVARWKEYRALRLEALKLHPIAFGASYSASVIKPAKTWKDSLASRRNERKLFFAQFNGKLVGLICIAREKADRCRHSGHITNMYVRNEHRGQGIASALMTAALSEAKRRRLVKVKLAVNTKQKPAIALYRKFGFQPCGIQRKEMKVANKYYDQLQMEKML